MDDRAIGAGASTGSSQAAAIDAHPDGFVLGSLGKPHTHPEGAHALWIINRVSMNLDERQFTAPEHFDIGRDPNPHQTFGHGIHFCLRAPLARLEAKIALHMLLERMPEAHIIHDQPLQQIESSLFFGPKHLPCLSSVFFDF